MKDLLTSRCRRKATACDNVGADPDDPFTRFDDLGMGHMCRRHVLAILDCQTLHEHAPGLGLIALDSAYLGHPVHLERHEPSIHLVEQPLPDPKHDIWSVHGVVER